MTNQIPQTDWSMIHDLSSEERARGKAMERLVRRYWPAIYAYIRRTGRDVHEASDLTQGFITTVILQRGLAQKAEKSRGKFRSLLLTSLRNYLRERHRYEARRKPRKANGEGAVFSGFDIDAAEGKIYDTPEKAFSYHWSAAMVRSVLNSVRATCLTDGFDLHWLVFDARVARPLLFGEKPTPIAELVERLDLSSPATASNMLVTIKRRFARALRAEIESTVDSEEDADVELAQLMKDLERK